MTEERKIQSTINGDLLGKNNYLNRRKNIPAPVFLVKVPLFL